MSRSAIRLTFKLHRFELIAVLGCAFLLVVAALVTVSMLDGVGIGPECFAEAYSVQEYGDVPPSGRCFELGQRFDSIDHRQASPLFALAALFPVLAGILVGAPAVGRELERGTLPLAWTLGGSRRRWLAVRLGVLIAFLLLALIPLAFAMDRLEAARVPTLDAGRSFREEGLRGWVLVARGLASFAVTALLGLVLGRQLPAVIVGVVASTLLVVGGIVAADRWAQSVAEPRASDVITRADRTTDYALRSRADGSIVTFEEAFAMQPPPTEPPSGTELPPGATDGDWIERNFERIVFVVPGARYPEAVLVGSAVLLGVTILGVFAGLGLVERRRAA